MNEVRRYGKTMSMDAAMLLADACGDLQDIINELNKLSLFVGEKKTIDAQDIHRHGLPDEVGDFKDLEEAVWTRNTTEALRQGELLSSSGVRPEMLFPVFERIFKNILLGQFFVSKKKERTDEVATKLGIRGKTNQENFQKALRAYKWEESNASLKKIVQADFDLKTGALSGPIAISLLIWSLCGRERTSLALR
jgi:DNA polymerase III delta subunit